MTPPIEPPRALTEFVETIDAYMNGRLRGAPLPGNLRDAVAHGLLAGGKRGRPVLLIQACRAVGGTVEAALPAAMAIELIHAFSLVHDDLPAMDDDDLRRGLPTVHVEFGEAMAILAGDAMMSLAFQIVVESEETNPVAADLCRELAAGTTAMIAGQVYDTLGGLPPGLDDPARLKMIHENKTGALMRSACRMGGICGGADEPALRALTVFGESLGLMFQIVDDLLDIEQTAEHTGKRTNKDHDAGKMTYPRVWGVEVSKREVDRLRGEALKAIAPLGERALPLRELADFLAVRTR